MREGVLRGCGGGCVERVRGGMREGVLREGVLRGEGMRECVLLTGT